VLEMEGGVGEVRGDRGGIRDETDPRPPEPRGTGEKLFESGSYPFHGREVTSSG